VTSAHAERVPGCVLGIDYGSVRVGLACSDPSRTLASAVESVSAAPGVLWPRLLGEVAARDAHTVVVGLPRRLDGSEGEAAAAARAFAAELGRRCAVAVILWDERFTTAQAERALIGAGRRRARRRDTVDAVAATFLLQSWLDAQRVEPGAGRR
jgi:putative Holliday junction resolvase